ncbi:MAG: bifunctional riboflavin kinase/FAD synthetase [Longimicrobiales bacterium]
MPLAAGLPKDERPTIVTVGTFDGVHLGHWQVLTEIGERARDRDGRSVLVTFHPHPLRVVRPEDAPRLLTTPDEKKEILAESGVDYAVFLAFTPALREYSPRRFVEEVLVDSIGMDELVIGYDHGFGRGRSGDVETLRSVAQDLDFSVDVVKAVGGGERTISSSGIRQALSQGRIEEANRWLGRPYSLRGVVVRGEGRGRALGFPTANLHVQDLEKLVPPAGIYAVHGVLRAGRFMGALHIGPRPTFPGSPPSVELFLIDFEGDIYGEGVRVDFQSYLRGVEPFGSVQDLVDQMGRDVAQVRSVLAG